MTQTAKKFTDLPLLGGASPILGHVRSMANDRRGFLDRLVREVDRVSRFRAFGAQIVMVNHPDVVHEVLIEKSKVFFEKSQFMRFAFYPIAGEGLFTSRSELWRKQRKMAAPIFQTAHIKTYADEMVECARRVVDEFRDGEVVELAMEMTRITMSVAGRTLFGTDTFVETDEIADALTVALEWSADNWSGFLPATHLYPRYLVQLLADRAGDRAPSLLHDLIRKLETPVFVPGPAGRRMRAAIATLDSKMLKMITARRSHGNVGNDLLAKLLQAKDDQGDGMSDKQVRDEALTLFVAGHETTANALAWSIHCLCRNRDVYDALEKEVDALPGDPTVADLPRLDLTLRVFKEALRLYPPAFMFGREAAEATTLDGYALEREAAIVICPYALHRRADLWPQPYRFDPDRFLPEAEAKRPRLAYIPFGGGPRICIGATFALLEGQLVLAKILRDVRFEAQTDAVPDPRSTLRPLGGMPMRVTRRR